MAGGIHNSSEVKFETRRRMVAAMGRELRVVETHSGKLKMREKCYASAADWVGFDIDKSSKEAVHLDSLIALRSFDLGPFNVFDIDPFGAPWHHMWIVAQRRKLTQGERIGLALTNGAASGPARMHRTVVRAGWSKQMLDTLKLDPETPYRLFCDNNFDAVAQDLARAWFGAEIDGYWSGHQTQSAGGQCTRYCAIILVGLT
jgi:hypothetical protein